MSAEQAVEQLRRDVLTDLQRIGRWMESTQRATVGALNDIGRAVDQLAEAIHKAYPDSTRPAAVTLALEAARGEVIRAQNRFAGI